MRLSPPGTEKMLTLGKLWLIYFLRRNNDSTNPASTDRGFRADIMNRTGWSSFCADIRTTLSQHGLKLFLLIKEDDAGPAAASDILFAQK
jgi:hypothetical protein